MGYDFANVISQANAMLASGGSGKQEKYSILYPGIGRTTVKLLFCPQSNTVFRVLRRHTCSDDRTKVMCYRTIPDKTYQDCPVCKIIDDIQQARGIDLFKYKPKMRGIAYAQFINSTAEVDRIQPNDVCLFMFPWTVYKTICEIFSNYEKQPDLVEKIIATNQGPALVISRSADNQYSVQLDSLNLYSTCKTTEEFDELLKSLPPLEQCIIHTPPTEEEINGMNSFANELRQKFLNTEPSGIQSLGQISQNTQPIGQYNQPNTYQAPISYQTSSYQAPTKSFDTPVNNINTNQNHPDCYGQQDSHDPNECLMCPSQIPCLDESKKNINTNNFPM